MSDFKAKMHHSIHVAQYVHALPLTIISSAYNPPTPHFHYANIALSLVMGYRGTTKV